MTETCLQDRANNEIWKDMTDLYKNPYKPHIKQERQMRGGVTIITKFKLNIHMLDEDQCTFQHAIWKVSTKETTITFITINHPPYPNQHPETNAVFLDNITEWLTNILPKYNKIILAGDFNLHVNDDIDTDNYTLI